MRRKRWRRLAAATLAACALALVFHRAVAGAALETIAGLATGTRVAAHVAGASWNQAQFTGLDVRSYRGEPILTADRVNVRYNLIALLGGGRFLGLDSIEVERPHATLIRRVDGTYNVPFKQQAGSGAGPPMRFTAVVRDGSLSVVDEGAHDPGLRELGADRFELQAGVDSAARTQYALSIDYVEGSRAFPMRAWGWIDAAHAAMEQHAEIPRLPIARLLNFAANTPAFTVRGGELDAIDALAVGLPASDGTMDVHVAGTAQLRRGAIAAQALAVPLTNLRGRFDLFKNGLVTDGVEASLGSTVFHATGGVFDLAHPHIRIAVTGSGDLARLRSAVRGSAMPPLNGRFDVALLAAGTNAEPYVAAALRSPELAYGDNRVQDVHALAVADARDADLLGANATYAGIPAFAAGTASLQPRGTASMLVSGGTAAMQGVALVRAGGPAFSRANLALWMRDRASGSLYAHVSLDRARAAANGVAVARAFHVPSAGEVDGAMFANGRRGVGVVVARATAGGGNVAISGAIGGAQPLVVTADGISLGSAGRLDASAVLAYANDAVNVTGASAAVGPATVDAGGRIAGLAAGSPRYDLSATVGALDLHEAAAIVRPGLASDVEGSLDAQLHVNGSGTSPSISGTVGIPEGSVYGQAFRNLSGRVSGGAGALALSGGSVEVGTTHVAFDGRVASNAAAVRASAPSADLADFNDLFDRGDVLAGRGRFDAALADAGGAISTSGAATLHDASVLSLPLGNANGAWHTEGRAIDLAVAFDGAAGRARASGSVAYPYVNVDAQAQGLDLATWLPRLGATLPVTGKVDAGLTARGRYPDVAFALNAGARDATARGIPIQRLTVAAHGTGTRATIDSATFVIPNLTASATGTFGLGMRDPLDLAVRANSPDVDALAREVVQRSFDAGGALDTTLAIRGTPEHPSLDDRVTLTNAHFRTLAVPHAAAELSADEQHVSLVSGELDLTRGRIFASGRAPVRMLPQPGLRDGDVAGSLRLDDVELSNFVDLLPKNTKLQGRLDGTVSLAGTARDPQLGGSVALANGSYSGPQEEVPLTAIAGTLALSGGTARFETLHANVGGGSIDGSAVASVPSLFSLQSATVRANASATHAVVDLPAYFKGQLDGTVALSRTPASRPEVSGNVAVSHARLPVSAFLTSSNAPPQRNPLDAAFDLNVGVDRDVRVQSPNVDVGGTGSLHVGGTLQKPSLNGRIESTGGTVSFYRDFRVERGSVSFDGGIVPDVRAVATTTIADPLTQVTIDVRGPADDMNVAFDSEPSYGRDQILALLTGTAGDGTPASFTGEAQNLALGQVNQTFTRELLEPLSANLGSALGLANLDIYNDLGEGFGFGATAKLGQRMSATGSEYFGFPRREDVDVDYRSSETAAVRLHVYQQEEVLFGALTTRATVGNESFDVVTGSAALPVAAGGTGGVELSLMRRYW